MQESSELAGVLRAGSFLVDSGQSAPLSGLRELLVSRLAQYHTALGHDHEPVTLGSTLQELQLQTAQEALLVVERVQQILGTNNSPSSSTPKSQRSTDAEGAPAIGTRDLAQLRTLLSIVFKWGVEPLLVLVMSAWPSKPSPTLLARPKIIDLTTTPENYRRLSSLLVHLLALLYPDGVHGSLPQTLITTTVLNRHLGDLLKPCIALGWLPKSLSSEATPTVDEIRPKIMHLLGILPPSQTISALGAVLSGTPPPATHARKSCASLLSRQLLRPEGLLGLCAAVFGEGEDSQENIPLDKLEQVAKVVSAVPTGMKPKEYFDLLVPRILALLSNSSPVTHRRAAAFILSHMLSSDNSYPHQTSAASIIIPILHGPFLQSTPVGHQELSRDSPIPLHARVHYPRSPTEALSTLMAFIMHTDPSPTLISTLLSPIMPCLYALSAHMNHIKTTDPVSKESVGGLLATWGRVVASEQCFDNLWRVLEGAGGAWEIDTAGEIRKVERSYDSGLSLLTPDDLRRAKENGELDFDFNLMNLRPDPVHFVHFLKSINRIDVASDLFVTLLDTYRTTKIGSDDDPMRTMLYLQVIMQMQKQLAGSAGPSNILSKTDHILSFIKHALTPGIAAQPLSNHSLTNDSLKMRDLRIVPEKDDLSDSGDSDDEDPHASGIFADEEMTDTAIDLLLAILEANSELSSRTAPILNEIFSLLEPLANERSNVQSLAREARMVMTARLASTSGQRSSKSTSKNAREENAHETYQKALRLLQDPILPVRAHGLLLLRQLVSTRSALSDQSYVDPALIPSITSIFLQAILDDDSYMFLNAIQGLAAMVETFGQHVLKSLIAEYSEHLDGLAGSNMTQNDVDKRIRIGEALGQIIRRCGNTLSIYAEFLVPPLVRVFSSHHIPTILRTSAISLLSESVNTSSLAFLPYAVNLSDAMIDLLQVESQPENPKAQMQCSEPTKGGAVDQSQATTVFQPISTDSKLPLLRRAALHFLTLLLRVSTAGVYDSGSHGHLFLESQVKRTKTTLAYIASTDKDSVVRIMAREAIEEMDQLTEATLELYFR